MLKPKARATNDIIEVASALASMNLPMSRATLPSFECHCNSWYVLGCRTMMTTHKSVQTPCVISAVGVPLPHTLCLCLLYPLCRGLQRFSSGRLLQVGRCPHPIRKGWMLLRSVLSLQDLCRITSCALFDVLEGLLNPLFRSRAAGFCARHCRCSRQLGRPCPFAIGFRLNLPHVPANRSQIALPATWRLCVAVLAGGVETALLPLLIQGLEPVLQEALLPPRTATCCALLGSAVSPLCLFARVGVPSSRRIPLFCRVATALESTGGGRCLVAADAAHRCTSFG